MLVNKKQIEQLTEQGMLVCMKQTGQPYNDNITLKNWLTECGVNSSDEHVFNLYVVNIDNDMNVEYTGATYACSRRWLESTPNKHMLDYIVVSIVKDDTDELNSEDRLGIIALDTNVAYNPSKVA